MHDPEFWKKTAFTVFIAGPAGTAVGSSYGYFLGHFPFAVFIGFLVFAFVAALITYDRYERRRTNSVFPSQPSVPEPSLPEIAGEVLYEWPSPGGQIPAIARGPKPKEGEAWPKDIYGGQRIVSVDPDREVLWIEDTKENGNWTYGHEWALTYLGDRSTSIRRGDAVHLLLYIRVTGPVELKFDVAGGYDVPDSENKKWIRVMEPVRQVAQNSDWELLHLCGTIHTDRSYKFDISGTRPCLLCNTGHNQAVIGRIKVIRTIKT